MNLPFPIALALEKAIDAALRIDPETRERLAMIDGRVVRVNVTMPSISIIVTVADGRIFLAQADDTNGTDTGADTIITGSLRDLRSILNGNDAVYKGDVKIEGDIALSQQLAQIVALLDPDWQEAISPYLGDSITHRLDMLQSRVASWVKRSRHSFNLNTSEYLQEEIEVLAPNGEVQRFCQEVDELRAAADRLQARVQRLEVASVPASDEN